MVRYDVDLDMNYDKQRSNEIEQERLNLKLKRQKEIKAEKDKRKLDLRRVKEKQLAGTRYQKHVSNEQDKRDQIELEKTERGSMQKAKREGRELRERAKDMGLTPKQMEHKFMNTKDLIRDMNRETEKKVDDLLDNVNLSKSKTNLKKLYL